MSEDIININNKLNTITKIIIGISVFTIISLVMNVITITNIFNNNDNTPISNHDELYDEIKSIKSKLKRIKEDQTTNQRINNQNENVELIDINSTNLNTPNINTYNNNGITKEEVVKIIESYKYITEDDHDNIKKDYELEEKDKKSLKQRMNLLEKLYGPMRKREIIEEGYTEKMSQLETKIKENEENLIPFKNKLNKIEENTDIQIQQYLKDATKTQNLNVSFNQVDCNNLNATSNLTAPSFRITPSRTDFDRTINVTRKYIFI